METHNYHYYMPFSFMSFKYHQNYHKMIYQELQLDVVVRFLQKKTCIVTEICCFFNIYLPRSIPVLFTIKIIHHQ